MNNAETILKFVNEKRLPRYREIPNVGLYLDQVVKYINENLEPLHLSITPSMLSNYVKKGYIASPIKKQYYAEQIRYRRTKTHHEASGLFRRFQFCSRTLR